MIVVYEASSMIQRDAILNHLEGVGIKAIGMERDISRRYSDSSVDIAFEGYSALMGGFKIFVEAQETDKAKQEIENFLRSVEQEASVPSETSQLSRFYYSTLFSLLFPFFLPFGFYYMFKGLSRGENVRPILFAGSFLVSLIALGAWGAAGLGLLRDLLNK